MRPAFFYTPDVGSDRLQRSSCVKVSLGLLRNSPLMGSSSPRCTQRDFGA